MTAISGTATAGVGIQGFGLTGVYGWGESYGIHGSAAGAEDSGVYGTNTNSTGGHGVHGEGYTGVYGAGEQYGAHGYVWGADDRGVFGENTNATSGYGVYGEGHTGVYGTGDASGVIGTASGELGNGVTGMGNTGVYGSGNQYGVLGIGDTGVEGSGIQYGVRGYVMGGDGHGVFGENTNTTSGYGVYGEGHTGVYGTGDDTGVIGTASGELGNGVTGMGHTGVYGSGNQYGVLGIGDTGVEGSGNQYGVRGYVMGDDGRGVFGECTSTTSGYGVYGEGHTGVYGTGDDTGVRGQVSAEGATGVLGCSDSDTGFGTVGWNYLGGVGVGAWSDSGNLIEAYDGGYPNGDLRFYVDQSGNVYADGGFYAFVSSPTADEADVQRAVSAIQSPEVWMEDFGTATLAGGRAVVSPEPVFAGLVNLEAGYHVYLTPLGDCQGLYVADKNATSFEVRELGGGKASLSFDYRIVARQAGYEGVRLQEVVIERSAEPEGRPSPEGGNHD